MIIRRIFAFTFLSVAVVFGCLSTYQTLNFKNQSNRLLTTFDGAYTCFHRVLQTYSAKASGIDNQHVSSNFINNTESCLTELKEVTQNLGIEDLDVLVTGLIDKVYWFHRSEDMQNAFTSGESFERSSGQSEIFAEIEELFEEVLGAVNSKKSELKHNLWFDYIEIVFVILLFALIFFTPVKKVLVEKEVSRVVENVVKKEVFAPQPKPVLKKTTNKSVIVDIIRNRSAELMNLSCPLEIKGVRKVNIDSYSEIELKEEVNTALDYLITSSLHTSGTVNLNFTDNDKGLKVSFENKSYCPLVLSKKSRIQKIKLDDGTIVGLKYESTLSRKKKELISLKKGKKKDLVKELMN